MNEAAAPHPSLILSLGIAALVMWRLYSRVRRLVGRQKLVPWRPWVTVAVFSTLFVLLAVGATLHPLNLAALVAGSAAGSALGVYAQRRTSFETTSEGRFYTPAAHVGIAVSLLFVGRVVFRVAQVWLLAGSGHVVSNDFVRSPVTQGIFGLMAGYYVLYAIGLIRWSRQG